VLFSDSYFTISKSSEGLLKEKGSKFLSFVFHVDSEKEIKEQLIILKKMHPSANHHCYAWRLGADKTAFRSYDDGEPANTAGKPILSQIQSNNLTNILIVVVRYFGGTLLGAGGLIQAYKQAAQDAIRNTVIEERFILFEYSVVFAFEDMNAVMRILKEEHAKIISTSYDKINTIIFHIKKQNSEKTEKKFHDLYTCKINFIKQY
jgi:uncharacterized YigZ family protein